jgi:hypothetical protein
VVSLPRIISSIPASHAAARQRLTAMKLTAKTPYRRAPDPRDPELASPPAPALRHSGAARTIRFHRIPLQLLRHDVWALRGLRRNYPPGSQGWEALAASEGLLMLEIRDTYGEAAWTLTGEYPYLDHRSLS